MNLSWGASTDNVGVTGYEIYRNGSLLTTKSGTTTTHSDTPVSGSTTYTYQVRALDAAGNRSAFGNSVAVTTPAGGTVTFSPDADAQVQEASPASNYGTGTYLRADGGTDPDVESYLKFTVSGVSQQVQAAKLRIYAYTGTVDGPAVYSTPTGWTETAINWNTKPAPTSAATDDKGNDRRQRLGRVRRRLLRHRQRDLQLPARADLDRRRRHPLARVHRHDPAAPSSC